MINSCLSYEGQLEAYNHAMKHIENYDFNKSDVQTIEALAHRVTTTEDIKPIPAKKYIEELAHLRRERKNLQKQIKKDDERIRFLTENFDMIISAEAQWLYGNDF